MNSFPSLTLAEEQSSDPAKVPNRTDETTPLLEQDVPKIAKVVEPWRPSPGFIWIEVGMFESQSCLSMLWNRSNKPQAIFSNVFLSGFDGTITASTYAVIGSEFNAANTISWLTTSYLITSTAFQPLYGRFSDILGRRTCFFTATITFLLGCLGCAVAPDVVSLNIARALTGLGGGGLMTMATIINSDMIPFKERGLYQACQNVLHGFGSICGASLGGFIADSIGWRWCFLCQVPISIFALVVGYFVLERDIHEKQALARSVDEEGVFFGGRQGASKWEQIDLTGSVLLVLGLSAQLAAMSMGGNNYSWADFRVIAAVVISVILLLAFVRVELRTRAIPIMPMSMLRGTLAVSNLISNVCVGMVAYSVRSRTPMNSARQVADFGPSFCSSFHYSSRSFFMTPPLMQDCD